MIRYSQQHTFTIAFDIAITFRSMKERHVRYRGNATTENIASEKSGLKARKSHFDCPTTTSTRSFRESDKPYWVYAYNEELVEDSWSEADFDRDSQVWL